jgi:hypothetical protein
MASLTYDAQRVRVHLYSGRVHHVERGLLHYAQLLEDSRAALSGDAKQAKYRVNRAVVDTGLQNARGRHRRYSNRAPLRPEREENLNGLPVIRIDLEIRFPGTLARRIDINLTRTEGS